MSVISEIAAVAVTAGYDADMVRAKARFWSCVNKIPGGCWEWTGGVEGGFGKFFFKKKTYRSHYIAWFFTHGVHPTEFLVHNCVNPKCVCPDHLRVSSHQEKMTDRKVRDRFGLQPKRATLTFEQAQEIRRDYNKTSYDLSIIADRYKVSRHVIYNIMRNKCYTHPHGHPPQTPSASPVV